MKGLFKWLAILAGVMVVILVLAAVLLPVLFDPNDHKERVEATVSEATGLPFRIEGEIGWTVFPWLGFEAGPLDLGNPDGFTGPHLARIDSVSAQVRVMPLIDGRIEMGTIQLDGVDVQAETDAQGRSNWEPLTESSSDGGSATTSGDTDSGSIQIAGLELNNAAISYRDASGPIIQIEDLNVRSGPVAEDGPVDLTARLSVALDGLPAPIQVDSALTIELGGAAPRLHVNQLTAQSSLGEGVPLSIALEKKLALGADTDALTIDSLAVTAGDLRLDTTIAVTGLRSEMAATVDLEIPVFDPRPLLNALSEEPLQLADPDALATLGAKAQVRYSGDRAEIRQLDLQFDETRIQGEFILDSIANLQGTLNASVNVLDVDRYLPADNTAGSDPSPDDGSTTPIEIPGTLTGTLSVGKLVVAGLVAENSEVQIQIRNGNLRLFPLSADLYGGKLTGAFSLRPKDPEHQVTFKSSIKDLKAGPLFNDLAGQPMLDGLGSLSMQLHIGDPQSPDPLRTADGTLQLRLRDGTLYGMNVMGMIRQASQLISPGGASSQNEPNTTEFARIVVQADIVDGVMTTKKFDVQAPYFRLTGDGSIDLAGGTMDYSVKPVLVDLPEGDAGGLLSKLVNVEIPVQLGGSMLEPEWKIDAAKLLLASQRGKIDGPAGELLDALSGQGGEGEQGDAGQALLDALLQEADRKSKEKERKKDRD